MKLEPDNQPFVKVEPVVKVQEEPPKIKKKGPLNKVGRWTQLEKQIYFDFLVDHPNDFESSSLRRSQHIFRQMSELIPTRDAEQCRGHHIKVEKISKSKDITKMISYLKKKMVIDKRRERQKLKQRLRKERRIQKDQEKKEKVEQTRNQKLITGKIEIKEKKSDSFGLTMQKNIWVVNISTTNVVIWNQL